MSQKLTVALAAGGTGGHLFPAQAVARALIARGVKVVLLTDDRGRRLSAAEPSLDIEVISAGTTSNRTHWQRVKAVLSVARGVLQAILFYRRYRPNALLAFGGYPTMPPIVGALVSRIPVVLHEQNAVLGKVNRIFAGLVAGLALSFGDKTQRVPKNVKFSVTTGNPVRAEIDAACTVRATLSVPTRPFHLVVTGGSQGAGVFGRIVPPAIAALPEATRQTLVLHQQTRQEDCGTINEYYASLGIKARCEPFFPDLPILMGEADLVIARSGASTCMELATIGVPALLVPLPSSTDGHQLANARVLEATGGAWVVEEDSLSADALAHRLGELVLQQHELAQIGERLRYVAVRQASDLLAELAIKLSKNSENFKNNTLAGGVL